MYRAAVSQVKTLGDVMFDGLHIFYLVDFYDYRQVLTFLDERLAAVVGSIIREKCRVCSDDLIQSVAQSFQVNSLVESV